MQLLEQSPQTEHLLHYLDEQRQAGKRPSHCSLSGGWKCGAPPVTLQRICLVNTWEKCQGQGTARNRRLRSDAVRTELVSPDSDRQEVPGPTGRLPRPAAPAEDHPPHSTG